MAFCRFVLAASCYSHLYPLAVQPRPHCSLTLSRSSLSRSFMVPSELRGAAGRRAPASHSCVTSTTSQPSTTGRRALQPGDLRARRVATSTMSATLTSRLSHPAPKYSAVHPDLRVFPDFHRGECVGWHCFLNSTLQER